MSFQEVSGLESKLETTPLQEGGENRFVHHLPTKGSHPNLQLKRALTARNSGLVSWCKSVLENDFAAPIKPTDINISLVNDRGPPVATWSVTNAYPVSWSIGSFDAMKNELAIETLELSYASIKRKL